MHNEDKKELTLVKWAEKQCKWQQHSLYLINKYGSAESIPEGDKRQVKKILIAEAQGKNPQFNSISELDIPDATSREPQTYLKALGPVSNIDKLASDQEAFEFASPEGMTVIFGNNGSGKSGYARILKNLCRSHGYIKSLEGDATSATTKNWEISLAYAEKNENEDIKPIKWTKQEENKAKNDIEYKPLERIAFFDAQVANTYVDEYRELLYFPRELRLYTELASFADELKKQLERSIEDLKKQLPKLPEVIEGTSSHNIISKLKRYEITKITQEKLNSICDLSEEEKEELRNLRNKKNQTPEQQRTILEHANRVLSSLMENVQKSADSLSSASLKQLLASYENYQNVKTMAEQNVARLAKDMPINKGIGSDFWLEMFKAARSFAGQVYPDADPPTIANVDLCVLCHQELREDAKNRLKEFDSFMDGRLQKTANDVKNMYENYQRIILSLQIPNPDSIALQLREYNDLGESKSEQVASIISDITAITSRWRKVKETIEKDNFSILQNLIDDKNFQMKADIPSFIIAIEKEKQHFKKMVAEGVGSLFIDEQNKLSELEDKEKCFIQKNNINKHFNLSEKINLLNISKPFLDTTSISRQSNKRHNKLVSNALKRRYLKELRKLDLAYLKISIGNKTKKGNPQVGVTIEGFQRSKKSDILSEGEQRVVALAGFLTEANETDGDHAIIFDDPVSSLDWDRLRRVAQRLAEEAKKRQIIVFTHNFSFALQLKKYFEDKNRTDKKLPFKQLWISKKSTGTELKFGITGKDAVAWEYKKVKKRINEIKREIKKLETEELVSDGTGTSPFEQIALGIALKLRKTWERAVEEILFNETVRRLFPNVMTTKLSEVQFDCNQDYQIFYEGYSTISEFAHDNPQDGGGASPTLGHLEENIELLDKWVKGLEEKRANLKCERSNTSSA